MRNTIGVKGARENNLKNIDLEIPREKLVVLTGLSGSGKSSLAFETLYAEGQRRFLESLSAYSRKYVAQLKKPDVDFVSGLSPVISIEQKSVSKNPRSTVGTMTDIFDYFRVLYATTGTAHCPYCRTEVPVRTAVQMAEHVLSLPEGTRVEIDAPVFKIYGEDYPYLFGEIRSQGYRRLRVDDALVDLSDELELDETRTCTMEAVIDTVVVHPDIFKNLVVSIQNGLRVGEGFLRFRVLGPTPPTPLPAREGGVGAFQARGVEPVPSSQAGDQESVPPSQAGGEESVPPSPCREGVRGPASVPAREGGVGAFQARGVEPVPSSQGRGEESLSPSPCRGGGQGEGSFDAFHAAFACPEQVMSV